MIDIDDCKKVFKDYVNTFDLKNEKIDLKIHHTNRVLENSAQIAKTLNLSDEDIALAALIGLLHDIGRFEQITKYDTFNDLISIDHASLGVSILKKDNFINKFVKDVNLQKTIFTAIENHNKYEIEGGLDEKTLMFCKIIRDADKLDIFRICVVNNKIIIHSNSNISPKILENLLNGHQIKDTESKTQMDYNLRSFAMLYDLNYEYTKQMVEKEKIPDKLIDKILENNKHEEKNLLQIKEVYYKKRGFIC